MRTPTPQDAQYAWWYAALKHGAGSPQAPIHADEPQCGYFKLKVGGDGNGNASLLPAYIAMEGPIDADTGELTGDEVLICRVGKVSRDPYAAWTWLAGKPVTYEAFKQAYETGKWPEEAPGDNFAPADTFEGLIDQLDARLAHVDEFKRIENQLQCDQTANLKDRLMEVHQALEAMRRAEKDPIDKAAQAVQNRFLPFLGKARNGIDQLRTYIGPFLIKAQEAAKRAAVEAGGQSAAAALKITAQAGGLSGKRTSTRSKKVPVIVNYKTAAIAVIDEPEVRAAVEKAVARWFREGKTAPGVEVKEETKVV